MEAEFDKYIEHYRDNLTNALTLSGHSSMFFAEYKAKKLLEWLPHLANKSVTILDFGCGDGAMTNFVSKYFQQAQIFGVDPSIKSIENAQATYNHINFSVNSESDTKLLFKNEMFDLIFCAGTFHHIPFDYHSSYLNELRRITKKNGRIVIFELNPLNPLTALTFKRNPIDKNAKMLAPWYCKKIANTIGYNTIKFYCFYPKWFSWLRKTERLLEKIPFGALYAIIIKPKH